MMGFGRRNKTDLPMASYSSVKGGGNSVHMESPAMRAIKNASVYTKVSYLLTFSFILMLYLGIRSMLISGASSTLSCRNIYCTLSVKKHYEWKKRTGKFHRNQLLRSNQVEINDKEEITKFITKDDEPSPNNVASPSGPIAVSFTLVLAPYIPSVEEDDDDQYDDDDAERKIASKTEERPSNEELIGSIRELGLEPNHNGEYIVIMRRYSQYKKRGTVRSQHYRLKQYIIGKRKSLIVRENAPPSWQGILAFIFGFFGFVLSMLLGQFWEEDKRPFVSRRGRRKESNTFQGRMGADGVISSGKREEYFPGQVALGRNTTVNRRR